MRFNGVWLERIRGRRVTPKTGVVHLLIHIRHSILLTPFILTWPNNNRPLTSVVLITCPSRAENVHLLLTPCLQKKKETVWTKKKLWVTERKTWRLKIRVYWDTEEGKYIWYATPSVSSLIRLYSRLTPNNAPNNRKAIVAPGVTITPINPFG